MNKENVLFGIIGLLLGLIIGFTVTNYINRNAANLIAATPTGAASTTAQPQVNNQVVRDQQQTGGKTAAPPSDSPTKAPLPQIQETLDRAQNEPKSYEAQIAAADMYYRIQRFDEAAGFYQKAIQIKPDDLKTLVRLGNVYYDKAATATENNADGTADFQKAEKVYLQALAIDPKDVNVRTDLGLTYFLRIPQDADRAIAEYRKSLEVNPNHELTLQNLAAALKVKGDDVQLEQTIAQLERVNPKNEIIAKFRSGAN